MIPVRDSKYSREATYVTWTLVFLNVVIYLWDRNGSIFGPSQAFADWAMRPADVVAVLNNNGYLIDLGKVFTAMFLHGNMAHLIGNMLFLTTFGPNVEAALGSARYALYYVFWGVVAFAAQIFVEPFSQGAVLGASGAIGGVLGAYFLLFPSNKVRILIPPFFWWTFDVSAFILLGLWFIMQIVFPQDGVATWAHAGGFMGGILIVLVLGGRAKVLSRTHFEQDREFDES